ncbi:MAG: endo-1,4-beta-xylanase [Acidobacteriota bacterium]
MKSDRFFILGLGLAFIFANVSFLVAAEDAYHTALRAQLAEQGIEGGSWVFTDSESGTLGLLSPTNVTVEPKTWSGAEPFTQIRELTTSAAMTNPWDAAIRFSTGQPVTQGDALLLVIWVRGISAADGEGYLTHIFEQTTSPYDKSLSLDQTPAGQWQQWMIPFQARLTLAAGQARYQINLGFQAQKVQIAGLAMLNFGTACSVAQLPKSRYHLDYAGHSPDAPWRAEALARIETLRKAPLEIQVVDQAGAPIPGATVHFRMKRHAFGFGTAVSMWRMLGTTPDDETYREQIFNLNGDGKTWSILVFENAHKWPNWEDPYSEGTKEQVVNTTREFRNAGIRVRGHNLVWPAWQYLPQDIQDNRNPDYVRNRIAEHIAEEAGYPGVKGQIAEWDVLNEPVHLTDLKNLFGGEQIYADWFKLAAQADPDAKLYINEYSIISNGGKDVTTQARYRAVIETILANGGRIDGIGMQGHMGSTLTGPEKVYSIFENFSGYGAAISITEFDASGADEEIMGDYMRDLLVICFSHPRAENFLMWGFWDGAHWHQDAPMFRHDWTLKPAGQAFLQTVFNDWWTDVSQVSDQQGKAEVRGFLGDYEVDVSFEGQTTTQRLSLGKEGVTRTVSLATRVNHTPRRNRGGGWRLAWSDEFNGPAIDTTRWEHQIGTGSPAGWGNNELEYYTDRPENSRIEDGKLVIEARKDYYQPPGTTNLAYTYTSARMRTKNKGDWTYGRFEFRARLPRGKGLWPAIWMLPTDDFYGTWPASGEIDIMEYLGHETNKVYGTLHYGGQSHQSSGWHYVLPSGNFSDDFHLFRLEWEPGVIRWYVDNVLYQTQPPPQWYTKVPFPAPFDKRFHLILNLAVGGNWPGYPDPSTEFPQRMEVDYVRVYQRR